jgi:hypothetical protein
MAGVGMYLSPDWLSAMRRYVLAVTVGNAVWEIAQLPFYTLWESGTSQQIAFAVLHCTGGDILIASAALLGALLFVGSPDWPRAHAKRTAFISIAAGLAYSMYSEFWNTAVHKTWVYSQLMPVLPWLRIGLTPFLQWLVVPPLALLWALRLPRTRA